MKNGYTQCHLTKPNETGLIHYHAYLPSDISVEGRVVKFKEDDGTWQEGWTVLKTYTEQEWKVVQERSQDYKKTRRASDI
jgi:hypothetical protein